MTSQCIYWYPPTFNFIDQWRFRLTSLSNSFLHCDIVSYSPPLLKPASNRVVVFLIISCTCMVTIACSLFPYHSWFYRLLHFIPQHIFQSLTNLNLLSHSSYGRWLSPAFKYLFQLCYNLFQDEGKRGHHRRTDFCYWIQHSRLVLHLFLNSFQHSTHFWQSIVLMFSRSYLL